MMESAMPRRNSKCKCEESQCDRETEKDSVSEEESVLVEMNVVKDIFFTGILIGGITGVAAWAIKKYVVEGDTQ